MRITSLSIAVSRTFIVAPYQPLKVEAAASCDLDTTVEDSDAEIARGRDALLSEVRASLREAYVTFRPKHAADQPPEEKPNA